MENMTMYILHLKKVCRHIDVARSWGDGKKQSNVLGGAVLVVGKPMRCPFANFGKAEKQVGRAVSI